jgi:hypothetical protein
MRSPEFAGDVHAGRAAHGGGSPAGLGMASAAAATSTAGPEDRAAAAALTSPVAYVGDPGAPFDPVLTVPAVRGRSGPPANRTVNDPSGEDPGIMQVEISMAVRGDSLVLGWIDTIGGFGGHSFAGYGPCPGVCTSSAWRRDRSGSGRS